MIEIIKSEFARISSDKGHDFVSKDFTEYEDYIQKLSLTPSIPLPADQVSVNLEPLLRFKNNINKGGVVMFDSQFYVTFLTRFKQTEDIETEKDKLIDQIIMFSERFFESLYKNENLVFRDPLWTWDVQILRQYTASLLCGVRVSITLKSACNRTQ